jgi:prepilin-type N-terminal cleavage/methylation domain-containing protein
VRPATRRLDELRSAAPRCARRSRGARGGFTLLEVLAVVLLTSIVIGAALSHYVNLSRATERASEHTRGVRKAAALLDRLTRDFEGVVLESKPPEVDPLSHPWVFCGEAHQSELGSDHLEFVTRSHRPRASAAHESDLATVAYALRPAEDAQSFELLRFSSPRLPEPGCNPGGLTADASGGARLLADGILSFGVSFVDEAGARQPTWDSSQLVESGELPAAVEIELALADDLPTAEGGLPPSYRRTVVLPVAPYDLAELLDPTSLLSGGTGEQAQEEEEGDEDDEEGSSSQACRETPCAGQPACSVINCQGKLGLLGESMDMLLRQTISANPEFCAWRFGIPRQVRPALIDNPACR